MLVTDPRQIEQYYQALVARDPAFVASFYVGVKTTGIFCISTCRARKPKRENVEFFTEMKDLLHNGYRPCKICKPTEQADTMPEDIRQALTLVQSNLKEKVGDQELEQHGLRPEKIRRWFKQHYGMTFHAFQRMLRVNYAFQELQQGKSVTGSAYEAGYDSLSGFGYTYKKLTGAAPGAADNPPLILIRRFTTPLGPMFACATEKGICMLEFVDRRMLETEFKDLQRLLKARIIAGTNGHLAQLEEELRAYFEGERRKFDVALDTPGTPFQQSVWAALQDISFGKTRSYQAQSEYLGNPGAIRAVASANGANRVSIVIPCHRVIGKDGSLTGYGGGLERKRWLLEHEGAIQPDMKLF